MILAETQFSVNYYRFSWELQNLSSSSAPHPTLANLVSVVYYYAKTKRSRHQGLYFFQWFFSLHRFETPWQDVFVCLTYLKSVLKDWFPPWNCIFHQATSTSLSPEDSQRYYFDIFLSLFWYFPIKSHQTSLAITCIPLPWILSLWSTIYNLSKNI